MATWTLSAGRDAEPDDDDCCPAGDDDPVRSMPHVGNNGPTAGTPGDPADEEHSLGWSYLRGADQSRLSGGMEGDPNEDREPCPSGEDAGTRKRGALLIGHGAGYGLGAMLRAGHVRRGTGRETE